MFGYHIIYFSQAHTSGAATVPRRFGLGPPLPEAGEASETL